MKASCPVCNGPKSKRAVMCAGCRRRAIAVGVDEVLTARRPRSSTQNSSYHGKCATLAALEGRTDSATLALRARAHKKRALVQASTMFGRPIETSKDLSYEEMSEVLDWLDEQISLTE